MTAALLYPLALLGGLAIAAPIWLHLRKEEHADLVEFSAMQFLDDAPVARSRPVRPRDWWLLLLRILALLLLVLAFSWPYLPAEQKSVIEESRVYILDNTLSHRANGGFEQARDRIVEELRAAGPEIQIAVIELTSTARPVVRFGDSPLAMADVVADLEPSSQRGSYLEAFRLAQQMLDQSLGAEHSLVFLGDSQENQWTEGQNVPPFLEDIDIELPQVEDTTIANLSLSEPLVQRFLVGNQIAAECSVQLSRVGDVEEVTLLFKENGREVSRQKFELEPDSNNILLSSNWPTDPEQWLRGEIVLEDNDDALEADDRAYFSLRPIRPGQVELYSNSVYLRTALSPDVMRGRWEVRTPAIEDLSINGSAGDKPPDVVCLDGHLLREEVLREKTRRTLEQGRGVILFVDEVSPVIEGFLRELGIDSKPGASVEHSDPSTFRYVFEDHPVFQDYQSSDFGNLNDIRVTRYRRLAMENGLPLAFSQSGHPLILEGNVGSGRLLVFAFSMESDETNWPVLPTFIPFLDRCLSHLRQEQVVETRYQPGEACVWSIPPGRGIERVSLRSAGEGGTESWLTADVENGQARFRLPDEPGHYELRYNSEPDIAQILDVNPAAEESELKFLAEPPALEMWQRETTEETEQQAEPEKVFDLATSEILKQDVWWWFLIAGMCALAAETIWVSLRKEQ
jgi:hypothetical protein